MTDPSENTTIKSNGKSIKTSVILWIITTVIAIFFICLILNGCYKKQCTRCESTDVKYKALFVPSGTSEYLCEKCYQKRNENPLFDDHWIVTPAQVIKVTKHNGLYNNK